MSVELLACCMVDPGKAHSDMDLKLCINQHEKRGGNAFYLVTKLVHAGSFILEANTKGEFASHSAGGLG